MASSSLAVLLLVLNALTCSSALHAGQLPHNGPRINRAGHFSRVPPHSVSMDMVLTEENAIAVLDACQTELATVFGSNPESLRVGITGGLELVELDGPIIVVRFTGRFWHARRTVLDRVENFVLAKIPECVAVEIEDESQLDDADPEAPSAFD